MDVIEQVKKYLEERWKIQPVGFIVSTKRIYDAIETTKQTDYCKIAEALDALGGNYFGKRSNKGLRIDTTKRHTGASKWQFLPM